MISLIQVYYMAALITLVICKNVTNKFYQLNVGIDENSLWYVNSSITDQDQYLRLDIAQPYVWVVDADTNQVSYHPLIRLTQTMPLHFINGIQYTICHS